MLKKLILSALILIVACSNPVTSNTAKISIRTGCYSVIWVCTDAIKSAPLFRVFNDTSFRTEKGNRLYINWSNSPYSVNRCDCFDVCHDTSFLYLDTLINP
jgi:hypothetical protein